MTTIDLANNLIYYIRLTMNQTISRPFEFFLTPLEIDDIVGQLTSNIIMNRTDLFLMVASINQAKNMTIGVSFKSESGGELIRSASRYQMIDSKVSALALINPESLRGVTHLSMLVIDKPDYYHSFTNSTNEILVSSIIVAKVQRNQSLSVPMNISLYFTKRWTNEFTEKSAGHFICSYYDTGSLNWKEFGCTLPVYNARFDRYECSCNHLTTFALLYRMDPSTSTTAVTLETITYSSQNVLTNATSTSPSSSSSSATTIVETSGAYPSLFLEKHALLFLVVFL